MPKICIEKLPHDCGSKRGLQVFQQDDGSFDGYCFSCGTYVPDPYGEGEKPSPRSLKIKTPEEIQAEIDEIAQLPIMSMMQRGISERVMKHYGVRISLSEYDGNTPVARWYPYYEGEVLKAFKCKTFDKIMFSKGDMKNSDLFGWHLAVRGNKYRLFITEGEDDAMALFRVLVKDWKYDSYPAVVSLKNGANSAASGIGKHMKDIQRMFKEVVLCFDNDQPGRDAVSAVAKLMPGVKVAQLPLKDANDMLMEGREKELLQAVLYEATSKVSGQVVNSSEAWHLAEQVVQRGLDWPWPTLTEKTRGRRRGEVYYFGAGTKMGKSVLVDELIAHCCTTQDTPVFAVKPEEPIHGTLKRVVGKVVDCIFHDPNIPFDKEAFHRGKELIGSKLYLYDSYYGVDWASVKQEIRQHVIVAGVRDIVLDPITVFTAGMSLTEQNETLVKIASELAAMSMELNFTAYIFCHLNPPQSGPSHERGGHVLSIQFTGSRSMMRYCQLMVGMEGNKDPELPDEMRNRRSLVILEDRNFGESAKIELFYNKDTGRLKELLTVGD